jgi:hypothetical protein
MKLERTIIVTPLSRRRLSEVREELIREGVKRNIHDSTLVTINPYRQTLAVTSDSFDFLNAITANHNYSVMPIILPNLN